MEAQRDTVLEQPLRELEQVLTVEGVERLYIVLLFAHAQNPTDILF